MILTGDQLVVFDPLRIHKGGKRQNFLRPVFLPAIGSLEAFAVAPGFRSNSAFDGCIMRLPLRVAEGPLEQPPVTPAELAQLPAGALGGELF